MDAKAEELPSPYTRTDFIGHLLQLAIIEKSMPQVFAANATEYEWHKRCVLSYPSGGEFKPIIAVLQTLPFGSDKAKHSRYDLKGECRLCAPLQSLVDEGWEFQSNSTSVSRLSWEGSFGPIASKHCVECCTSLATNGQTQTRSTRCRVAQT